MFEMGYSWILISQHLDFFKPANNSTKRCFPHISDTLSVITRLLPKEILKGPLEPKAQNLGAQHLNWKVLLWKIQVPRAILRVPQATRLLLGNSLE